MICESLYARYFRDNPVHLYLHALSWRRFRRWGWLWIVPPTAILAICTFVELIFHANPSSSTDMPSPAAIMVIAAGPAAGFFFFVPVVFALSGVGRMMRQQNIEQLLLTRIEPLQIWAAVLFQLNRNLLILLGLTLPPLALLAGAGGLPVTFLAREGFVVIVLANLWTLIGCVLGMQGGFRSVWFALAVIGGACAIFFIPIPFIAADTSLWNVEFLAPAFVFIDPIVHWFHATIELERLPGMNLDMLNIDGASGFFLGRMTPWGWTAGGAIVFLAAALGCWLLAGPFFLPESVTAKERGKGRQEGFFAWLFELVGRPTARLFGQKDYPWRTIIESFYANSSGWVKRRRAALRFVTGLMWWILFVIVATDFAQFVAYEDGGADSKTALQIHVFLLAVLGLLPAFQFAFAGAAPSPTGSAGISAGGFQYGLAGATRAPRYPFRLEAYGAKMAVLYALVIFAYAGFQSGSSDVIYYGIMLAHPGVFAFVLLIALNQAVVQGWLSLRSRDARRAIRLGLAHGVILWVGPFAILALLLWIPAKYAAIGPVAAIGHTMDISPILGLFSLLGEFRWPMSNSFREQFWIEPIWLISAAYLALETLFCEAGISGRMNKIRRAK